MFALLPFIAVGTAAFLWLERLRAVQPFAPMGPQMLHAGVPYRFVVRMETGSGSADVIARVQKTARDKLAAASNTSMRTEPVFTTTDRPPPWSASSTPGWGRMLCTFAVTLTQSEPITVGTALPGFGTLESVERLDGKNFTDPA